MAQENKQSRYLDFLPALFHSDKPKEEGSYLGQFLLPFEEVLTEFENELATIDKHLSPARTPEDFVPWLASWVAMAVDDNWDEHKQRQLIRQAVKLYRHRGMAVGIQEYLAIYDERLIPTVYERAWPGGMQIGVASQIGGLTPDDIPLSRIKRVERHLPPRYHDHYAVDTSAPAGDPQFTEGEPLRFYYPADRVESVHLGHRVKSVHPGEPGDRWSYVRLELHDGESRLHEQASIIRQEGLVEERYTITPYADPDSGDREGESVHYRGSTDLNEEVELPYRFTLEIQVPCQDWEFLFHFELKTIESDLPEAFWQELTIHGISLSKDRSVTKEEYGLRWWRIEDGDPEQEGQVILAARKGIELDVYRKTGYKAWERATRPQNVHAIRAIVDEVKPAHTVYTLKFTPLVSEPAPEWMQIGVHSTIDVDARIG